MKKRPFQNTPNDPHQHGHPTTPAGGDPRTDVMHEHKQKLGDPDIAQQPMGMAQQHGIGGGNPQLGGNEVHSPR